MTSSHAPRPYGSRLSSSKVQRHRRFKPVKLISCLFAAEIAALLTVPRRISLPLIGGPGLEAPSRLAFARDHVLRGRPTCAGDSSGACEHSNRLKSTDFQSFSIQNKAKATWLDLISHASASSSLLSGSCASSTGEGGVGAGSASCRPSSRCSSSLLSGPWHTSEACFRRQNLVVAAIGALARCRTPPICG